MRGGSTADRIGTICVLEELDDQTSVGGTKRNSDAIAASSDDAIICRDLEGRIHTWNAQAERLFGYTSAEAVGHTMTLIIPAELRENEISILERVRRGEEIAPYNAWRIDKYGRRVRVLLTVAPLRDEAGSLTGVVEAVRTVHRHPTPAAEQRAIQDLKPERSADVVATQQVNLQCRETPTLEAVLLEILQTACTISDTADGLISVHDPQQDRLVVVASVGVGGGLLSEQDRDGRAASACWQCIQERRRIIIEDIAGDPVLESNREGSAGVGIGAVHCTPLTTRAGQPIGVLTLGFTRRHRPSDREARLLDLCGRHASDCIDLVQVIGQLQKEDERRDEFTAVLAHELRNRLAPLSNATGIMQLSDNVPPALQSLVAIMETQVQHLVRLAADLLDLSRIAARQD
ncbi:MAG: PAS domain S-box protein [Planctomycetaceae bacterium]